eukprot:2043649-Pyramimonas_sp.AAC.2
MTWLRLWAAVGQAAVLLQEVEGESARLQGLRGATTWRLLLLGNERVDVQRVMEAEDGDVSRAE